MPHPLLPRKNLSGPEHLESRIAPALVTLDLGSLNGSNGFSFTGTNAFDLSGYDVSGAGDINGDGFDDLIVGAPTADPEGRFNAGETYIVFGKAGGFSSNLTPASLNGSNGFRVVGSFADDQSGWSVSGVGDLNNDGFDDLIIGANLVDQPGKANVGGAYIVFGRASFNVSLNVSQLDGTNGFRIGGIDSKDYAGFSVSGAGDVNGDGFQDIVIGAYMADPNGLSSGETYVVFGKSGPFTPVLSLSDLNGSNGFRINGIAAQDESGRSVSGAGDVNGDGFDDIIIGAYGASPSGRNAAGESYVVLGHSAPFSPSFDLSTLNGSNGFRIAGVAAGDRSGVAVAGAGDVNGDGLADLVIGATPTNGKAYVLFGLQTFATTVQLSSLNGTNGFRIDGDSGLTGKSVAGAGDVNGDGYDDVLIGDPFSDPSGNTDGGATYVIYGKGTGFSSAFSVSTLNGTNGFKIFGSGFRENSGYSVSSAGDLNGDGFSDLVIGAHNAEPDLKTKVGRSYVIFGRDFRTQAASVGKSFTGTTATEIIVGSANSDVIAGKGGQDVIVGGAGDDLITVSGLVPFRKVSGGRGFDTLKPDGTAQPIDLAKLRGSSIEQIDLTAGGGVMPFSLLDVLQLSNSSNTLRIVATAGDNIFMGSGWAFQGLKTIEGREFTEYTQAAAKVLVSGQVQLSSLQTGDGTTGFILPAGHASDFAGASVDGAGDVNGDGYDDFIVSASRAEANGRTDSGEVYVLFGKPGGFAPSLSLGSIAPGTGFTLFSSRAGDELGASVSTAGDFNGDGISDIIIGSSSARTGAGEAYIVFGSKSGFPSRVDVTQLSSSTGLTIQGSTRGDRLGLVVNDAGDVNGDGFADVIIGTPYANGTPYSTGTGRSYVIFGRSGSPASILNVSSLNGTNGFALTGKNSGDFAAISASGAGDVNGDGLDDLVIGARNAAGRKGEAYVVFGSKAPFPADISLGALNGTDGFIIPGLSGYTGTSVGDAGDVNGDGFDDFLISAPAAGTGSFFHNGETYLIFGKPSFPAQLSLTSLDGTNGVTIVGVDNGDYAGSVERAGDVNGDGFDDFVIGANQADTPTMDAGEAYLVFGSGQAFPSRLLLGSLDGRNGLRFIGIDVQDRMGASAGAGDINGDGFDDLVMGARAATLTGVGYSGEAYVVFGSNFTGAVTQAGSNAADTLTGTQGRDVLLGGAANDVLSGNGGNDVFIGGEGDDTFILSDATFARISGGTGRDTVKLAGTDIVLDLRVLADNRLRDVEAIDIVGEGSNTLILDQSEVLRISGTTNTLLVRKDRADVLDMGPGWTLSGSESISDETYTVFTQGLATLKVGGPSTLVFTVTATADSGKGSLRDAILTANADIGLDRIQFDLPSAASRIVPATPLPEITDSLIIDGTSQPGYLGVPLVELVGTSAGAGANGLSLVADNVTIRGISIHGFDGSGIYLADADGAVIDRNDIGPSLIADDAGNGGDGIHVEKGSHNTIGSLLSTGANRIAFNGRSGVAVVDGVGNSILGNLLFSNGSLGIDLGSPGPTPNDPQDIDTGANDLQNAPILTGITESAGLSSIRGTLTSTPGGAYRIEFFSNDPVGSNDRAQAQTYVGSLDVVADQSGVAAFEFKTTQILGALVTATATDVDGNTSEISPAFVPVLTAAPLSLAEGDGGITSAQLSLTLSGPTNQPVTVAFQTEDGSAQAGTDYNGIIDSVVFAPGETTKTVTIQILADTLDEANETFTLHFSASQNAILSQDSAEVTILNDDSTLFIASASATEASSSVDGLLFEAKLSQANILPITVNYATLDQTATGGIDYTPVAGTLVFAPGEISKQIRIPVQDDTVPEADETFVLLLSAGSVSKIPSGLITGTILNDDTILSVADVSQLEGHGTGGSVTFVATLNRPSALPVTVGYTVNDGDAIGGVDYESVPSGTLTFAPGETSKVITVHFIGDTEVEPSEKFSLRLSDPINAVIQNNIAFGTILNDDVTIVGRRIAQFTDSDGDSVTVKVNKGTLSADNFTVMPAGTGEQLALIDLQEDQTFRGGKLTVTAKRAAGGNGSVNVGFIDASGIDLSSVVIKGDLGRIEAGDQVTRTAAIGKLAVQSLGQAGLATQLPDGSLRSAIVGPVKTVSTPQGIANATFDVSGGAAGSISKVNIGRDMSNGTILVSGSLKSLRVAGDFKGSVIEAGGTIGSIFVNGSVAGGAFRSNDGIKAVKVAGDLTGDSSGAFILSATGPMSPLNPGSGLTIGSLSVDGSVAHSQILAGYNPAGFGVSGSASIGPVKVNGSWIASDLIAGAGAGPDGEFGTGDDILLPPAGVTVSRIASIVIKGSVAGTETENDSFGFVAGEIGSFRSGNAALPLVPGPGNDISSVPLGTTADVHVREVAAGSPSA